MYRFFWCVSWSFREGKGNFENLARVLLYAYRSSDYYVDLIRISEWVSSKI